MNVAIRADASVSLGTGHVMRCLALSSALKARGATVVLLARELTDSLSAPLRSFGVGCLRLAQGADCSEAADAVDCIDALRGPVDWLVVDHYRLGEEWERALRGRAGRILAIDDLGRRHDCDLVLDQNLGSETRYTGRLSTACGGLFGPSYALLRPEFARARAGLRRRNGRLERLLVSFGGSDPSGETRKALDALLGLPNLQADVLFGSANPRAEDLARRCCGQAARWRCHPQTTKMASLMADTDLAIGAGGSTTWERCCLGLPALTISVAANQDAIVVAAQSAGVSRHLGTAGDVTEGHIGAALAGLAGEPRQLAEMEERGLALVDGLGADRVASAMGEC